jgi:hypothetical protein
MKGRAVAGGAVWVLVLATAAVAEPCNPAIHGTYCATDMRKLDSVGRPTVSLPPIQNFGMDVMGRDQPGTLGAITSQGGKQCIGLLRRARCN